MINPLKNQLTILLISSLLIVSGCIYPNNNTPNILPNTNTQTDQNSTSNNKIIDQIDQNFIPENKLDTKKTLQEINEETENILINVVYPITENETVNKQIKDFIDQQITEFKKEVPEINEGSINQQNSLYINYTNTSLYNKGGIQSFKFDISTYTGGAHPNTFSHTFTFEMSSGNLVNLSDIFTKNSNYLSELSKITSEDLKTQLIKNDSPDFIAETIEMGTEPTEENFRNWVFDNNYLTIHFDPYQVASYAEGPQMVNIPLIDLSDILNNHYFSDSLKVSFLKFKRLFQ